jgi:hypothetical protein
VLYILTWPAIYRVGQWLKTQQRLCARRVALCAWLMAGVQSIGKGRLALSSVWPPADAVEWQRRRRWWHTCVGVDECGSAGGRWHLLHHVLHWLATTLPYVQVDYRCRSRCRVRGDTLSCVLCVY